MNAITVALSALKSLAAAGTDPKVSPSYLEGLVRVRPDGSNRGSFVETVDSFEKTEKLLTEQLKFVEKGESDLPPTVFFPKARYFHAEVPAELVARTGILNFGSLTDEQKKTVRLVDGAHGPELAMDWSGPLAQTTDVWVICGREDGLLWTWYPGPVTPRQTPAITEIARKVLAGEEVTSDELALVNALAVKLQTS